MEWITQLTLGEQLIAALAVVALLLLGWVLSWLAALRGGEGRLVEWLESRLQRLPSRLPSI